ncbi:MAG: hypothetical protein ABI706_00630 [Ilumatobacteraceae bacterium]
MKGLASLVCPVCLLTTVVGCGAGDNGVKVGDPAGWIDDVCTRMIVVDLAVSAEHAKMDAQIALETDPTMWMLSLEHFLGEVAASVTPAGADIDRLGAPPIPQGDSVRRSIKTLFDTVVGEVASLEVVVRKAGSSDNAVDEAAAVMAQGSQLTDLDSELRSILTDDRQLSSMFDDAASCAQWARQLDTPATTVPDTKIAETTVPPTTVAPTTTSPTTTPPTTVAPSTTPAPTTVPVTLDPYIAVREQYLIAADEYNPKLDEVWNTFHGADGFILYSDAPTYCDQTATLEREWGDRMSVIAWPPDALDEAQAESAQSVALLDLLDQCAAAPATRAGQEAILDALDLQDDAYYAAIDALRQAIGLPARNG